MKKVFTVSAITIGLILLLSCSAYQPPKNYNYQKSRDINKSYNDTWQKVINYFASANLPIKVLDKSSGLISTEINASVNDVGPWMDCGVPAKGMLEYQFENPTLTFNIVVQSLNSRKTNVTVNTFYKIWYVSYNYNNYQWVKVGQQQITCNSTGRFETDLINYLQN